MPSTTALQAEPTKIKEGSRNAYKFEQVWYLVERRRATQVSFLKINQLNMRFFGGKNFSFKPFKLFCSSYVLIRSERVGGGGGPDPPDPPPGSGIAIVYVYEKELEDVKYEHCITKI